MLKLILVFVLFFSTGCAVLPWEKQVYKWENSAGRTVEVDFPKDNYECESAHTVARVNRTGGLSYSFTPQYYDCMALKGWRNVKAGTVFSL